MIELVDSVGPLRGRMKVPGDKSISHRAVLFAAMAEGSSSISGLLDSADVRSTMAAVEALGAKVKFAPAPGGSLEGSVEGWGRVGPLAPNQDIDCGNSGTTARLLLGALSGYPVVARLTGDVSLSRRPMKRVTEPLGRMGARFESAEDATLPLTVYGGDLQPIRYESPVASAQVKSAVLLAGLGAHGRTVVVEPSASRDHTELMLPAFGVPVEVEAQTCRSSLVGPVHPVATTVRVPGDPSSAAFMIVAALLVPGSDVTVEGISLNPTRTGFLAVLHRMGADVDVTPCDGRGGEVIGDVRVRFTERLRSTTVEPNEVPSLIDEIPILALAAALASGETRFRAVGELRVKESDRLTAIAEGLAVLGVEAAVERDDLVVNGTDSIVGGALSSLGDHRLAMTWAVAGLVSSVPVRIDLFEAVDVSYPTFMSDLRSLAS